jgi:uncharacterized cofD-like protein
LWPSAAAPVSPQSFADSSSTSAIPNAGFKGPFLISLRSSPSPTTAEVPAAFAATIVSFRQATFAIAWSRFRRTKTFSESCFNTVFRLVEASPATASAILTALTNITGDFPEAVHVSSRVLAIRGRIFPSTTENVTLEAELEDGSIVAGETKISSSKQRIRRIHLVPRRVRPISEVLAALHDADLILVGPGSLYTSLIPNLLVQGVTSAIARSSAKCVYIANLMTQPGETEHYSVADHVRAIYEHTRVRIFDSAVINRTPASPQMLRRYRAQGAEIVKPSLSELKRMGLPYITSDLLQQRGKIRHDTVRLANLLLREFVTQNSYN